MNEVGCEPRGDRFKLTSNGLKHNYLLKVWWCNPNR